MNREFLEEISFIRAVRPKDRAALFMGPKSPKMA